VIRPVIAIDETGLPPEVRASARAVVWRYEQREKRDERDEQWTKVPYQPRRPRVRASSTDPVTWGTFAEALAVVRAGKADGVGIVLVGDGRCIVDLDHVRDPVTGALTPEAIAVVQQVNSYTELSPSGTGLRIIAWGTLPPGGRHKGHVEVYDCGRYFTVTGAHLPGTPRTIEQRTAELAAFHRQVFSAPKAPAAQPRRVVHGMSNLDDQRLIAQAHAARNGDKFAALWRGDTSGYPSQSEADCALCSRLAYWTGGDVARIDRLFRQSGLYRSKWDCVTYREPTIARALR
jgi:primase-polymerase (primpol)-like protein